MQNTSRVVKIARIYEHKTNEYKELHDTIPEQIVRHLTESGIKVLEIYLQGDILVMVLELDPSGILPDRQIDEEQERSWQEVTGVCFRTLWQDAELIFDLNRHRN